MGTTPKHIRDASAFVKETALHLGFSFCGIAKAEFLEEEAPRLERWLKEGKQGEMSYMANHFDKRLDPRKLVEGTQSVISLLYNYYPEEEIQSPLKISKYAYGTDYHKVLRKKLKTFFQRLNEHLGEVNGRAFVDSAPVLDKVWAKKAGLGWMGKNANLITKPSGSFFFIAELLVDIPLDYDNAFTKDFCGSCTKCIDACPTQAIVAPYVVDGSRCISYLTIELKNNIPSAFKGQMDDWVFGCDTCQDVCPWNRFSIAHQEEKFSPSQALRSMSSNDWVDLSQEVFNDLFTSSPVKRTGYEGLVRNIKFSKEQ